ncbi:MAG: DnaJ C-terminal domain-containing protein [Pseudomonadota bacterium]
MKLGTDNAYAELGLAPDATQAEVKAAWRRLVSQWHPDRNNSASAVHKMQRLNHALEQIRLHARPDHIDRTQAKPTTTAPQQESSAPHHQGHADAHDQAQGHRAEAEAQRRTIHRKVKLTLEEAAAGCIKTMQGKVTETCTPCAGAGYQILGGVCPTCDGSGTQRKRTWYGWLATTDDCEDCQGTGIARQVCAACEGTGKASSGSYKIPVRIPHGVRDNDLLHVDGRLLRRGAPAINLDLRISVMPHPFFKLDDDGTIRCEIPVDGFAWIANRTIDVPTLTGLHSLPLSREQLSYRLSGQGFPIERRSSRGDQIITIQPLFPERLSTDQEILLDQLVASSSRANGPAQSAQVSAWSQTLQAWEQGQAKRKR